MPKRVNTVSQALRRIKELKGRVALLDRRMHQSVCWVEPGNKPTYDYSALDEEREEVVEELVSLKGRLAKTNSLTDVVVLFKGSQQAVSLQTAVFVMAELKAEKEMLAGLTIREGDFKDNTGEYDERGRPIVVTKKCVAALGTLARDGLVTELEKSIAEINEIVEDANHRTTLLE